jgi:anti-sigma factor RsiW
MANNPVFERFREISWRRALTDGERAELEAWLSNHPEFRAEWEAEMALSASLTRLPDPGVPSNFTARVLQAVERESAAEPRLRESADWWRALARRARWVTGPAFVALAVLVGIGIHERQAKRQHELALADSVRIISKVPVLPNAEVLANFETIRAMNQSPPPDDQLLALLE